jgi:recombinational DNA repair protein RecR
MKGLAALDRLTAALKRLPGVGPRSAQTHHSSAWLKRRPIS